MADQKASNKTSQGQKQHGNFGTMDTKQPKNTNVESNFSEKNGQYENQKQGQISSPGSADTTQS